jgi:hypothetical protein
MLPKCCRFCYHILLHYCRYYRGHSTCCSTAVHTAAAVHAALAATDTATIADAATLQTVNAAAATLQTVNAAAAAAAAVCHSSVIMSDVRIKGS